MIPGEVKKARDSWLFLAFGNSWIEIQLAHSWQLEKQMSVLKVEFAMMDNNICYRIENTDKYFNSLWHATSSLLYLLSHGPESLSVALLCSQVFSEF